MPPTVATPPAPQNFMTLADWAIIAVYLIYILVLGSAMARRQTTSEHYFIAGHRIPGWATGISMFATLLSSFTFIAFPGWTYDKDWQLLMREGMAPLAVMFCAILIIPIYRQAIRMSAYEYLAKRFGTVGRIYGTVGFLLGHFLKTGVVLYTMAIALSAIMGVDIMLIIIILGVITLVFTFLGGMEGVVWTEVVQGGLMLISGLIVIGFLIFKTDVPGHAIPVAWHAGKFKIFDPTFDLTKETFWVFASFGIFHFLTKYATDQTMVQRYLIAPSLKEAVRGTLIGLACCIAAWLMFFLIGSMLWGFYHIYPDHLGAAITKGDQVFPYFIGRELPIGVTGLVMAGLFAAAQSTISGDINCIGACVTSDFLGGWLKNKPQRVHLITAKTTVMLSGIGMTLLSVVMTFYKGGIVEFTMDVGAAIGSVIGGGLLAMFLLGFFTRRVTKGGMYFALVCSIILTSTALCFQEDKPDSKAVYLIPNLPFHLWILPIISNVATMIIGYVASLTLFRGPKADIALTVYGYDIMPSLWHNFKDLIGIKSAPPAIASQESQP